MKCFKRSPGVLLELLSSAYRSLVLLAIPLFIFFSSWEFLPLETGELTLFFLTVWPESKIIFDETPFQSFYLFIFIYLFLKVS